MNNSQVTVPRNRDPLGIPFSLFCAGISRNSQHHHLTLSKGQVVTEKSYPELCDDNFINIAYDTWFDQDYDMVPMDNDLVNPPSEMGIHPSPGRGFLEDRTNIAHNGEIFQSFVDLCRIGQFTFKHGPGTTFLIGASQLLVGPFQCNDFQEHYGHFIKCLPPHSHAAWYLFTKEGFKINKNVFIICQYNYSIIFII